jgi:hypothetical protein
MADGPKPSKTSREAQSHNLFDPPLGAEANGAEANILISFCCCCCCSHASYLLLLALSVG